MTYPFQDDTCNNSDDWFDYLDDYETSFQYDPYDTPDDSYDNLDDPFEDQHKAKDEAIKKQTDEERKEKRRKIREKNIREAKKHQDGYYDPRDSLTPRPSYNITEDYVIKPKGTVAAATEPEVVTPAVTDSGAEVYYDADTGEAVASHPTVSSYYRMLSNSKDIPTRAGRPSVPQDLTVKRNDGRTDAGLETEKPKKR